MMVASGKMKLGFEGGLYNFFEKNESVRQMGSVGLSLSFIID